MQQYYDILGVRPNATLAEIKKSYRKKALKLHPDINPSSKAKEEFIRLDKAYNFVVDLKKGKRHSGNEIDFTEILNNIFRQGEAEKREREKILRKGYHANKYRLQKEKINLRFKIYYVLIFFGVIVGMFIIVLSMPEEMADRFGGILFFFAPTLIFVGVYFYFLKAKNKLFSKLKKQYVNHLKKEGLV